MKFTLSWLKDYLITSASLEDIVDAMTMAGLEVEDVANPSEALKDFTIAKVKTAEKHPDADKLKVCKVQTKDGTLQIVCGAPNARAGMNAVFAPLGTYIPGLDFSLDKKPRKIRGVESHGMMCSAAELGLGDDHDGILDIEGNPRVGKPAVEAMGLDDPIIDFEVTPNRPDWLGVTGIARDLAAAGLGRFKNAEVGEISGKFPCPVTVDIEHTQACPVFTGRLIKGVKNGPSPDWMQRRLKAVGINPKNMLVDVTNYISLDRARPLHVYDADKLTEGIVVRLGRKGESFLALDGKTYDVGEEMCVITDGSGVIGFGGVMGGETTGCSDETINVFIESAWFDPDRTARTGRDTGIISDARYRFERGVDPQSCQEGAELATRLILETCGGEPSDMVIAGSVPLPQDPIAFRKDDVERLTGLVIKPQDMRKTLKDLGFEMVEDTGDHFYCKVPGWRRDMAQSADFVEEIARIYGFDKLPEAQLPPIKGALKQTTTPMQVRVRTARRVMAARGFPEAVTWSFVSTAEAELFGGGDRAVEIANPVASELNCMRPSALPTLAKAAQRNADYGEQNVRLFEAGPIYLGDGQDGDQKTVITAVVRPDGHRHWQDSIRPYDSHAAKADLLALLEALRQPSDRFQIGEPTGAHWHPGRSASLRMGPKTVVANFGELHPRVLKALDVSKTVYGFELVLDALPNAKAKATKTKPVFEPASLTPIRRDFAFVVSEDTPANEIARLAKASDKQLVTGARVFDVYQGKGVEDGSKSVAVEVEIQPRDETLTDKQIEALSDKLVKAVAKGTGAVLRS